MDFPAAVYQSKALYEEALLLNNRALEIADNLEATASDIGNLGEYLSNLGVALALLMLEP